MGRKGDRWKGRRILGWEGRERGREEGIEDDWEEDRRGRGEKERKR